MNRTMRAAAAATLLTFLVVFGMGVLLGLPASGSAVAGVVLGLALGGILVGAAVRSGNFHDDPS